MAAETGLVLSLTQVIVMMGYVITATAHKPWICEHLCSCELDKGTSLFEGNCSHRGLTEVPQNLPSNFIHLDFSYNQIPHILANQFVNLTLLRTLDLSNNHISTMDQSSFYGLNTLKQLWLNGNQLILRQEKSPFEPLIFSPLHNLESIYLHNNSQECNTGCGYPDKALGYLINLNQLHIDGLPHIDFGPGFTNLTRLQTLKLGNDDGNCNMPVITNTTFLNLQLTNLKYLHIVHCDVDTINPEGFRPLRKIHTLELIWHNLTFSALKTSMTGLSDSPIKVLILNHVHPHGKGFILPGKTFEDLVNTSLTQLSYTKNGVVTIEISFSLHLPKSLKLLDVSNNFMLVEKQNWLVNMVELTNLTVFNFSHQGAGLLRSSYSTEDTAVIKLNSIKEDKPTRFHTNTNINMLSKNDTIFFPVNLQYFYLQGCKLQVRKFNPINFSKNNLIYIDISGNLIQLNSPVYGLHKLEHFDVSGGKSSILNKDLFMDMPSLKKLLMKDNKLKILSKDKEGVTFSKLHKLRYLDLSDNGIEQLPKLLFKAQYQLQTLLLNSNYLNEWIITIGHMSNLTLLDLSRNQFSTISDSGRQDLDKVIKNSALKINLMNNPLQCSCNDIEFLKWLNRRKMFFVDIHKYSCTLPDGTNATFNKISLTLHNLEVFCNSKMILIGAAVSLALLVGGLFMAAFIYRHRWQVSYYKNRLALRLQLYQPLVQENEDTYTAFLSYEDSLHHFIVSTVYPVLELQYGFKLCIHTRDFVPGNPVAFNICHAVHFSKHTIAFVTEQYFKSEWCLYEFKMAYLECVHTGKQLLVLALMEPVDISNLTNDIKQIFKYVTYLEYSNMNESDFFQKLAAVLQD